MVKSLSLAGFYPFAVRVATPLFWSLIVPGPFVYFWLTTEGVIPAFLGGYIPQTAAFISILCLSCFGTFAIWQNLIDPLFYIFVLYVFIVAMINFGVASKNGNWIIVSYISMLTQWLSLYITFKWLEIRGVNFKLVGVSFIIMTLFVIDKANFSEAVIFTLTSKDSDSAGPTYQDFSMYYLVCTLLFASLCRLVVSRYVVYAIGCVALFLLGARSELVGFLAGTFIVELISVGMYRAILTLGLALIVPAILLFLFLASSDIELNRTMLWILSLTETGVINDDQLRSAVNTHGMAVILDSPVLGSFGYYSQGEYIHNFLSIWADFGIVGFLLYCLLLSTPLVLFRMFRKFVELNRSSMAFALSIYSVSLLLVINSKSFGYGLVAVSLGTCCGLLIKRIKTGFCSGE